MELPSNTSTDAERAKAQRKAEREAILKRTKAQGFTTIEGLIEHADGTFTEMTEDD